jgi:hypothetical protein
MMGGSRAGFELICFFFFPQESAIVSSYYRCHGNKQRNWIYNPIWRIRHRNNFSIRRNEMRTIIRVRVDCNGTSKGKIIMGCSDHNEIVISEFRVMMMSGLSRLPGKHWRSPRISQCDEGWMVSSHHGKSVRHFFIPGQTTEDFTPEMNKSPQVKV